MLINRQWCMTSLLSKGATAKLTKFPQPKILSAKGSRTSKGCTTQFGLKLLKPAWIGELAELRSKYDI